MLRKSELSNVVFSSIFPVRKPFPRGLNGTNPIPSSSSAAGFKGEAELGYDRDLIANRRERFAHELFVGERPIGFGGIEKRDAPFDGRPSQGDHLLLIAGRAVSKAHPHAAQAHGRDV